MRDPVAFNAAAGEVDDVEARFARRFRKVDDADESAVANPRPRIERGLGLGK